MRQPSRKGPILIKDQYKCMLTAFLTLSMRKFMLAYSPELLWMY